MTYDEIVSWGYEVLNFVNGKFTVYAAMDNEIDGEILWRNDPGNPDIYWIQSIQIDDGKIVVDYVTGNEEGNDVAAFDMNTGDWVWTAIHPYY